MIVITTWKTRPMSPEQAGRMMNIWGKIGAELDSTRELLFQYHYLDGSGGVNAVRLADQPEAMATIDRKSVV